MNVKNLLELIAALKLVTIAVKDITKDGIAIDDLPKALELIKKYEVILAAINDIDLIDDEVKDLDSAEAIVVVSALMAAVKEIKEA